MLEKFKKFEIRRSRKSKVIGGSSNGQPGGAVSIRIRGTGSLDLKNEETTQNQN